MDNNTQSYRVALSTFCMHFLKLRTLCEQVQNGEAVEPPVDLIKKIDNSKKQLFAEQKSLGFEQSLAFLEDANFAGFRIENLKLKGSHYEAYKKANEWSKDFLAGKTTHPIFFETANLITFMLNMKDVFAEKKKEEYYNYNNRKEDVA